MILTVRSLLEDNPHPTDDEIRVALGGNLCRCGCYVKIMDAVKIAAGPLTPGPSPSRGEGRVMRGSPGNTPPSRLEGYCTRKGDEE
jgi:hypothetical protein